MQVQPLLLVFIGGGVGSVVRYGMAKGFDTIPALREKGSLPWATLIVNVLGCLLIGVIAALVSRGALKEEHRLLLAVGLMGGFTTFSTYGLELVQKATEGQWMTAGVYLVLSNVLGIVAVVGGMKMVG